ncbi:MAG TPA: hypothetical protein RMH99_12370 [Sandaracinaceae bacterium LLY-WYZ-13_1]|nr:hypothetical protein [Sandaracinaceae bacterium LLY-WYZ-13_1]
MRLASAILLVVLSSPGWVAAQDGASERTFTRADPEVSDTEVIRWAARELGRADGRPTDARPPVPPDPYLGHGSSVPPPSSASQDAARILAEIGTGSLGILIGGGAGTLLIWAATEGGANPDWMLVAGASGTVLAALGVSAGVALGADVTGGRGNFGHAFLGQAVGSLSALPFVVYALSQDAPGAALVAAGLLPLAGAVLGYELAHGLASAPSGEDPPVVAWMSPVRDGAMGGVAGRLH